MKPDFALSLSFDGIALLQRASVADGPAEGWYRLGEVALTVDDLSAALADLRRTSGHDPSQVGPEVKLILPEEQVRMLDIPALEKGADPAQTIEAALDGATPYKVGELAYDFAAADDRLHIVAVARETLIEAESFALDHDFVPLGFVTMPPAGSGFPREPFLGPSKTALTSLTPGISVEADDCAVSEIAKPVAELPQIAEDEAEETIEAAKAAPPEVADMDAEQPQVKTDIADEPAPETRDETETETKPEPNVQVEVAVRPVEPEAPVKAATDTPKQQNSTDTKTTKSAPAKTAAKSATNPKADLKPNPAAKPKAEPKAKPRAAPKPKAQVNPGAAPNTKQNVQPLPSPAEVPKAAKPAPTTSNEQTPAPGFSSIRARRDAPTGSAAPVAAPSSATPPPPAPRPVPQPEQRLPEDEADAIAASATASLTERPRAEDTETPTGADKTDPTAGTKTGANPRGAGFATAAMARASTGLGKGIGFVSRRTAQRKDAKAEVRAAKAQGGTRMRLRPGKGAASAITAENMMEERDRLTVFGARQPQKIGGKPRFLGLIMTVVLLIFLLGVAAWASVFLEGGLASLFGRTETPVVAALKPDVIEEELVEDTPESKVVLPETALTLPEIDSKVSEDEINLASLSEGVPTLSDELIEEQLDGLSVPFEAEMLTPEQAKARYAATGIWQRAPAPPAEPEQGILRDLYVASIDPSISQGDAVAIPTAREADTDLQAREQRNPLPPDAGFEFTDEGLIKPTPEGVVSPEGYTLVLGPPPLKPPPRAGETPDAPVPAETTGETTETPEPAIDPALAAFRPRPRPGDLIETNERANLGGISLKELAAKRPRNRPEVSEEKTVGEADETATEFAVASSLKPSRRPSGFARLVDRAQTKTKKEVVRTAAVAPKTVKPRIPSSTNVAREATVKNAINLRKVNLIGVYGKPSSRRALVRLSNGRYKKVKVGDRIDGGRVAAIGESQLSYTKSGRSVVLRMPKG